MQITRGNTWRSRLHDAPGRPAVGVGSGLASPPPVSAQRVWAFLCPNPVCDTELVVFPDDSGELVQCPTCGFEFTAPRVVPLQIASPEGIARPFERAFAPGAVIARPPSPRPSPAPSPPPSPAPRAPGTGQAAAALEHLASGVPVVPQTPETPETPRGPTRRGTVDALDALAQAAAQPGAHPAPARVERRTTPRPGAKSDRRGPPRANFAPAPAEAPARSANGRKRTDLVLTWSVAGVVSLGLGLAAWVVNVPDLALGSILFVGLAGLRTFLVVKPARTDRPLG